MHIVENKCLEKHKITTSPMVLVSGLHRRTHVQMFSCSDVQTFSCCLQGYGCVCVCVCICVFAFVHVSGCVCFHACVSAMHTPELLKCQFISQG